MSNELNTSTLRPGLLVSLNTTVSGNVSYRKTTIEDDHIVDTGAKVAQWETLRVISDPEEYEAAKKIRSKCRTAITRVCAASAFGLLCPEAKAAELAEAIREANVYASEFNARAKLTRVGVYIITGKVAADDVEAVKAINYEMRDLLSTMTEGLKNLDVEKVRDAANKARDVGAMLTPQAAERVQGAIDAARKAARQIVKAGETTAGEIDAQLLKTIERARTSFLDLDGAGEVQAPEATGVAVELETQQIAPAVVDVPAIEM